MPRNSQYGVGLKYTYLSEHFWGNMPFELASNVPIYFYPGQAREKGSHIKTHTMSYLIRMNGKTNSIGLCLYSRSRSLVAIRVDVCAVHICSYCS